MRFSRKKLTAFAAGVMTLGLSAGAYAYWTTTGAGDASTTVASTNGTVTLHASIADGIYPGGSKSVSFTADNPGATDLRVGTISLASVSVDAAHSACNTNDFSMADVASNTTVLHGANGQALSGTGSLLFANDAVNSQNACKGATLTLHLTSN
jgi:hypothetical protein